MDYELVRQLRDAGFPLKPHPKWAADKDGPMVPEFITPTLEELIEMCGNNFDILVHDERGVINYKMHRREEKWSASSWSREVAFGSTPTEAVARLWLALHANRGASA
jgi:hypothetical protein